MRKAKIMHNHGTVSKFIVGFFQFLDFYILVSLLLLFVPPLRQKHLKRRMHEWASIKLLFYVFFF